MYAMMVLLWCVCVCTFDVSWCGFISISKVSVGSDWTKIEIEANHERERENKGRIGWERRREKEEAMEGERERTY